MSLNITDVIDNIESYMNANQYSYDKMAELFDYKGKSSFAKLLKSKNVGLKFFVNFLNNSKTNASHYFNEYTKVNDGKNPSNEPASPDYTNRKIEELKVQIAELEYELKNARKDNSRLIQLLCEMQKGGCPPGESKGGVVPHGKTG